MTVRMLLQVSALEEELQQREADLRAAHAQLQATQRSLVSLQVGRLTGLQYMA